MVVVGCGGLWWVVVCFGVCWFVLVSFVGFRWLEFVVRVWVSLLTVLEISVSLRSLCARAVGCGWCVWYVVGL